MIYIVFLLFLVFLSYHYDLRGNTKNKEFFYRIVLLVFILIAGLRYRLGIDTPNYIKKFYYRTDYLWNLSFDDFSVGSDPLYMLLNSFVYSLGGRFYIVQLFHAIIVNTLILNYAKKHSPYIFVFSVFYYLIFYYGAMDVMRASLSISICLYANDYLLNKSWIKGTLLYLMACLFHVQTLVIVLTPILFSLRVNKKFVFITLLCLILGFFLKKFIENNMTLLIGFDIISSKMDEYVNGEVEMFGNRLNLFGIVFYSIPVIYAFFSLIILKKHKQDNNLLKLEPLLLIGVAVFMISTNAFLVYRFVNYYYVYFLLFISHLFIYFSKSKDFCVDRVKIVKAMLFFLPFFFYTVKNYLLYYKTYYPYSSVIDKEIDRDRERILQYTYDRDSYNLNEY